MAQKTRVETYGQLEWNKNTKQYKLCFDLLKLIPYLYKTKHNGDDSPKDLSF